MTQTTSTYHYRPEQITALGGREWTSRQGQHRVYLNGPDWAPLAGLDIDWYGTGSIRSVGLAGHSISNSKAGRLLSSSKVWLDVASGRIETTIRAGVDTARLDREIADTLIANLHVGIAAAARPERTAREAAAELGVSISTIYRRAAAGKLTARKESGRWLIRL